ncbi:Imm70 family immunity protein [Paenibacillus cymbidii]|uniref:Imm70 family immunity protein n=1 Tax=Paenibacillus cymbidii TaxID=1639034 RepID=UPI0010819B09|nr:Imm70 family immunity protein [Paenibacillus cymbidii]
MAIYFKIGFAIYTIGPVSLLNSLFSAIGYRLEPDGWGTWYPIMMNQGYQGKIEHALIPDLIKEVKSIPGTFIAASRKIAHEKWLIY